MTTTKKLKETVTACGNVLRGSVEVGGKEFTVEADLGKTWCNIIDEVGGVEGFVVDVDGDVISASGECVTNDFRAEDWAALTEFVGAK
jgi:hypothetical protein